MNLSETTLLAPIDGVCYACRGRIPEGAAVVHTETKGIRHTECPQSYVEWTAPAALLADPPPDYVPEPDIEGIHRALSSMATHCERHAENDRAVCRCLTRS